MRRNHPIPWFSTVWKTAVALLFVPSVVLAIPDDLRNFLREGDLNLSAGALAISHEYAGAETPDQGIGIGYMQVRYRTPDRHGLSLGAAWVVVAPFWENHRGDFDDICPADNNLRDLYASWTLPATRTAITAGRFKIAMSGLDGDSHQAVRLVSEDVPGLRLQLAVVDRWVNNARIHPNFLGMERWRDADDLHDGAGGQYWLGSLAWTPYADALVEPFMAYQKNVMFMRGVDWNFPLPLGDRHAVGFDGNFTQYGNEWPEEIKPGYEDVLSWIAHAYWRRDSVILGVGWHGVGDNRGNLGAGLFFWIDPLTVDETIPYNDFNNAQLYYADAKIRLDNLRATFRYGFGVNRAIDVDSHEINALVFYDITPSLQWAGIVSWNRYSGDVLPHYTRIGAMLKVTY